MNRLNIGFIGLGIMGKNIAKYLLNISKNFYIIKRGSKNTREFLRLHKKANITVLSSYKKIASLADVIITCVGNDNDLRAVFFGNDGIINGLKKNCLLIDHTTCSEEISKVIFKKCQSKGCSFFDAPMSGGEIGAETGKLSLMVGGNKRKFSNLKIITRNYSKSCIYMGPSGSGQLTKMVNQIFVASIIQGLAEGLNFAKKKKLNINKIVEVTSNGAAQSWQLENRALTMVKNNFNFGFMNKLMYKDLNLVFKSSNKNLKLPITKILKQYYRRLIKEGHENEDTSSLIRLLK